jgi:hypothetical protein
MSKWSTGLLLLGAVLGPPILGVMLIVGLPRTPSANGSILGMNLFPWAALVLAGVGAYQAKSSVRKVMVVIVALVSSLATWLFFAIAMMAP